MAVWHEDRVGAGLALGAAAGLGLVGYGVAEKHKVSLLSVAAAAVVLIGYGVLGLKLRRVNASRDLGAVCIAGLAAGGVFGAEVLLEYIYRPSSNVVWGYAEFGTVFLIYAVAAAFAAWRGRPIGAAVRVATLAAVIASLIWCVALLSTFYAFEGTRAQSAVLIAEGDPEDFLRSGLSDYRTFLIEDFFGAIFFHLSLGPPIAAILGLVSSVPIRGLRRWSKRAASRQLAAPLN